jgi:hypothetical protein
MDPLPEWKIVVEDGEYGQQVNTGGDEPLYVTPIQSTATNYAFS